MGPGGTRRDGFAKPRYTSATAHQDNPVAVTAKIGRVERQQPALPVRQHGRDDVRVVNLPTSNGDLTAQRDQGKRAQAARLDTPRRVG